MSQGVLQSIASLPRHAVDSVRMKPIQAMVWMLGWGCWTLGSLQYYSLPFTLSNVAKYLDVPQTKISEANTTAMISRMLGALIFGIFADQYGRKIPLLVNLVFMGVFSMCTGFANTYGQLIGCRLLFGVAYGGTYGLTMAMVMEAVPRHARGIVAGFTQQGFSCGYILASGLHLAMDKYSWRALFWLAAGLAVPLFLITLFAPTYSITAQAVEDMEGTEHVDPRSVVGGNLSFFAKLKYVLLHHPKGFVYSACLSACLATMGHGTMDLYPTFLTSQRKLDILHETWVTVILQIGGISGGVVGGYLSHRYSPKWVALAAGLLIAPWLPLWVLPKEWNKLATGAFFLQFFYGAAIGNLGNLMQQLCPHPGMRAAFTGVTYNIGNAISSIAPTIETSLGERFPTADGTPDYALTQMILVGIVIGVLSLTLITMPLKSLNKEWDEEDPNAAIPTVPTHKEYRPKDVEIGEQRDPSGANKSDGSQGQAVHIEQAQENDDSITKKP